MDTRIHCGPVGCDDRFRMAEVIDSAFGDGLGVFLPDRDARLRVLAQGIALDCVVGGYLDDQLAGVVGLATREGGVFDGLDFALLRRELGVGAIRARLAMALLERPLEPGKIRVEFVAVETDARGQGLGSMMIEAVTERACALGASQIELHVEPGNLGAQRLYEPAGFRFAPSAAVSLVRRKIAPQTDLRMIKELKCTIS